jgi:hypothetical protein
MCTRNGTVTSEILAGPGQAAFDDAADPRLASQTPFTGQMRKFG